VALAYARPLTLFKSSFKILNKTLSRIDDYHNCFKKNTKMKLISLKKIVSCKLSKGGSTGGGVFGRGCCGEGGHGCEGGGCGGHVGRGV